MSDPASTLPEVSPHEGASKMQPQHAVIDDTHPHRKEEGTQIGAEQLSPGSRPDSAETRSHVKEEASKAAPTTMKPKPCSITDTSRARKMDDTKPKESPTTHHPSRVSNLMSTSWIPDGIETASFRDTISALEKYTAIMTIGNTTGQITEPNDPRIPPKVAALAELIQEFTHSHPKAPAFFYALWELTNDMASVKKGMSGLRDYVQSQSTDKDHLYEWEKYQDYETLGKAIKGLEAATEKFKKLAKEAEGMQMPRRLMTTLVQNAIMTSISVSDMAHYILRTMNSKTRHCFEEVDKSKFLDSTKTEMKDLIIQDATALLCSTTDTTRATYTSLDLLLKILHDATEFDTLEPLDLGFPKSKKAAPTGSLRKIVTGVLIALPLLSAFCFNPWLPPTELYQRLTEQTHVQNLHLQTQINQLRDEVIKTVRAEPHMQAEELTELYGRMDALGDNIKTMEKQFQDVGLRIDNLWEALGPPNEHGTYFDPSPNGHYNKEPALPSSNDDQGHLQMSRQQFKALDAEIVKLRREMHRVDIRLTREVKNIQRKI